MLLTHGPHLLVVETGMSQLPVWDPLNHKEKIVLRYGDALPGWLGFFIAHHVSQKEQKVAINEIYILASLYKRQKDLVDKTVTKACTC